MRTQPLFAILFGLFFLPVQLQSQAVDEYGYEYGDDYETRPIECPTGFNNDPETGQPVWFERHEYQTQWFPVRSSRPLSSYEYYRPPTTTPNLTSIDRKARWMAAAIWVSCSRTRSMYLTTFHYHIESKEGYTQQLASCDTDYLYAIYDPYDSSYADADCSDTGTGGGGGGGGGDGGGGGGGGGCRTEYIVIEISYDGGKTWHTYWEGNATVCE